VETADDMLGALAHLADGGIDVVVASLHLPDASGTDVIVSLRERAPEVPVIVVGDAEAEPSDAFGAGASDVLPPDAAADLVARAIRYAVTLRKVEAGLRRYQAFDELTGLLNQRGFDLLAKHHFRLADRSKDPVIIVFLRVDRAGGAPGDPAVADAATVISSAVRVSDVVARVGSDAFCVLLAGAATGTEPIVLERIVESVAAHNAKAGRDTGPSVSVGAASYDPEHPIALESLIAEADRRMRRPSDISDTTDIPGT
jgi:diguanylate cyclase (GGDEF)-like protein